MNSCGTVTDSTKKKRRNRKALLRACAELQSKSWKLVDMQGVDVPAKLLNFFLQVLFFYQELFILPGKTSFFLPALSLSKAGARGLKGSLSLDYVRLVCMIDEPGPARGQSSSAGLQLHPAKCLDGDKFIVVPPAYPR